MKSLSPFDTVCAARMAVYKRLPYFMKMLYKLIPVEAPGAGTFFVDAKLRVHFDPELALKSGVDGCAAFLAHEVQHPLREHHARGAAFIEANATRWAAARSRLERVNPILAESVGAFWNIVADLEINTVVLESGFKFPDAFTVLFPKDFELPDGDFAEAYARALFERAEAMPDDSTSGKSNDASNDSGNDSSSDASNGDSADGDPRPGDNASQSSKPNAPSCGSCCGAKHRLESELDESTLPNGSTPAQVEVARRQVAHDTLEPTREMVELLQRYGTGSVAGVMRDWARAQLAPPAIPWQRVFAPLVRSAVAYARGRVDWKFGRPSRRREALKQTLGDDAPLLPTLESPIPNVGIIVDTSGSMNAIGSSGRRMLDEALSEIVGIVTATGVPTWAAAVDASVQAWVRVRSKCDAKDLIVGGGGTDMRVGIAAAAEKKFDLIVLVTDGLTDWPTLEEMPRHSRLIACITTDAPVPSHITRVVRVMRDEKGSR